jgi:hypothetical protein
MTPAQSLAPPRLLVFPAAKQRRLDALLEKNSEGTITAREHTTLTKLVADVERLMVTNAQLLAQFSESSHSGGPVNATPVTVWITPAEPGH